MKQIHFNRENLSFALFNILEHKVRSLLTVLGIIVGIVTVVLVASVLVGVRNNIALLFQEFGPDSIFAFHLNGDPGGTDVRPEERSRKPLRAEFVGQILSRCASVKDAAAQIYVPNLVGNRPLTRTSPCIFLSRLAFSVSALAAATIASPDAAPVAGSTSRYSSSMPSVSAGSRIAMMTPSRADGAGRDPR